MGARRICYRLGIAVAGGSFLSWNFQRTQPQERIAFAAPAEFRAGHVRSDLPSFSAADVAKHRTKEARIWVTYKAGVYDVTDFIPNHPGGAARLMLAAGGSIDPFWTMYTIHTATDEAKKILESYRIGNLAGFDEKKAEAEAKEAAAKMWQNQPERHLALEVRSERPFNAETPAAVLGGSFLTPTDLFYVRGHFPVPSIEDPNFCLKVSGEGLREGCLTVKQLKELFPQHTITAALQCGGNRRTEIKGDVKGLAWKSGAIGNATWTGVWMRDVLEHFGATPSAETADAHVVMSGADKDVSGGFEVSIPYHMAMAPHRDVLIAFEMNGQPLTRDHGAPMRAIVPGVVAVRSCKFLNQLSVQQREAQSVFQQKDYKNFPSWLTDPSQAADVPCVYEVPVTSAVLEANRVGSTVSLRGFAYCGGGEGVQRVELSTDGGRTFKAAAELDQRPQGLGRITRDKDWGWRLWSTELDLPSDNPKDKFTVCSRAYSGHNHVQPPSSNYNFRGLLANGYSCVDV